MRITYDQEADVAYIKLIEGPVTESEEVAPGVVLDFDAQGRVLGIEFVPASKILAPGALTHLSIAAE
jgi:uncharacterized protein YuzE